MSPANADGAYDARKCFDATISKLLVALGVGVIAGPEVLRWLVPHDWADPHFILKEAARFTLAISVFGIALRTPKGDYARLLRPVGLLLTLGMRCRGSPLMDLSRGFWASRRSRRCFWPSSSPRPIRSSPPPSSPADLPSAA